MADQFSRMYDVERVGGDQRTRLAEMLRAAGQNAPQGQMVSGWYVAPSWSQNLNTALSGALGTYLGAQLDQEKKEKIADFLKKYQQGAEVSQEPVMQNFNRVEGVEGQTPAVNQPAQNELQRAMGRQPIQVEGQTVANQAMVQPRPVQPQYRPWTREEKESMLMEAYQVDPRMAGVLSDRMTRDFAREDEASRIASDRQWREKQAEIEDQRHRERMRLEASLRPGPQPQAPVAVIGPDGRPMFVAPSKAYGMTPATEAKPLTEGQAKASAFQSQMVGASNNLNKLQAEEGYDPTSFGAQAGTNIAGGWGNIAASGINQRAKQAQDQWLEAYLRFKTGAAATPSEMEINRRTFFPVFGEKPESVAQKAAARTQAENDIGIAAGRGNYGGAQPQYSASTPTNYGAPPAGAVREKK